MWELVSDEQVVGFMASEGVMAKEEIFCACQEFIAWFCSL
jgi:hypothetical protein